MDLDHAGRLDGAICEYDNDGKMAFLEKLHKYGVRNIEMEAAMFASFTHRLGIRGTGLCATLLDRLEGDQVCWWSSTLGWRFGLVV